MDILFSVLLDPHLTLYHSNIGVRINTMLELGTFTLQASDII